MRTAGSEMVKEQFPNNPINQLPNEPQTSNFKLQTLPKQAAIILSAQIECRFSM